MTAMDGGRRPAGRRETASRISSRMARAWAEPSIRRAGTRPVYRGETPESLRERPHRTSLQLAGRDLILSPRAGRDVDSPSPVRGGVGEGVSLGHLPPPCAAGR